MKLFKGIVALLMFMTVSACVTVEPAKPIVVNGAASYNERLALPPGCTITIAVIDLDTPGVIVAQKTFNIARVPVPFKFILPADTISDKINYGVVSLIQYNNKVIFQTYDKYPVINNGPNTVEVIMKAVPLESIR